jgi:hypothetical protein
MTDSEYLVEYGFERVTPANFQSRASQMENFVLNGALVPPGPVDIGAWVVQFQEVELTVHVPKEIRLQFEVAKACMTYGILCYPLLTLGQEQLFRIGEAAARAKAASLGGSERFRFFEVINFLTEKGVIRDERRYRWDAIRNLRNSSSHPERQTILAPGMARRFLGYVAEDIEDLFRSDQTPGS